MVEAICKLKCGIFVLKTLGKFQIQGKDRENREFPFNLSVATLLLLLGTENAVV